MANSTKSTTKTTAKNMRAGKTGTTTKATTRAGGASVSKSQPAPSARSGTKAKSRS